MKRWEKYNTPDGAEIYNLFFSHHGGKEKNIVCLFRNSEDAWKTTSDLLGTFWMSLTTERISEQEAKEIVEKMVIDYYKSNLRYYQEMIDEFEKKQ